MPKYQVQDPDSGRALLLEGDSPPTEQELETIFKAQSPGPATETATSTGTEQDEAVKSKAVDTAIRTATGVTSFMQSAIDNPAVLEANAMGKEQGQLERATAASDAAD